MSDFSPILVLQIKIENYMLCKAPKELVIVPGARHLCSAYADPELYQRTVMEFFEKYDL